MSIMTGPMIDLLIKLQEDFRARARDAMRETDKAKLETYRALKVGESNAYWYAVETLEFFINQLTR